MVFDWDENKSASNLSKHGVSFESAKAVFMDPSAIIESDESDDVEERWRIIGMAAANVLFVVFTERNDGVNRIITARRANRHEQDRYFRQALP